jgi:hypothetical protein
MTTTWQDKYAWLTIALKRALAVASVAGVCGLLVQTPAQAAETCALSAAAKADAEAGIKETMAAYNAALNGGETKAVLPLYTDDGVFMPPYSQSAVGKEAVKKAYDKVFDELKFHVRLCVQVRLACSAGNSPAGVEVRAP